MTIQTIAAGLTALAFAALSSRGASAFERQTQITTDRGTITRTIEGHCADGKCWRQSELTGPNGGTLRHTGECSKLGRGVISCTGKATFPGGTVTHHSIILIDRD